MCRIAAVFFQSETCMSGFEIFVSWLATLLLAFVMGVVVVGDPQVMGLASLLAVVFSLPYLLIMIGISQHLKRFWPMQCIHFAISIVTAYSIYIFAGDFVENLYWLTFLYFALGFILQGFWWNRRSKDKFK